MLEPCYLLTSGVLRHSSFCAGMHVEGSRARSLKAIRRTNRNMGSGGGGVLLRHRTGVNTTDVKADTVSTRQTDLQLSFPLRVSVLAHARARYTLYSRRTEQTSHSLLDFLFGPGALRPVHVQRQGQEAGALSADMGSITVGNHALSDTSRPPCMPGSP